jgi:hypothetical protein
LNNIRQHTCAVEEILQLSSKRRIAKPWITAVHNVDSVGVVATVGWVAARFNTALAVNQSSTSMSAAIA